MRRHVLIASIVVGSCAMLACSRADGDDPCRGSGAEPVALVPSSSGLFHTDIQWDGEKGSTAKKGPGLVDFNRLKHVAAVPPRAEVGA